jgi:hypothetical protein
MAWNAEHLEFNGREHEFMKVTRFLIPKVPGIDKNIGKVFNLYRFLVTHKDTPSKNLAPLITEHGKPLFEVHKLKEIMETIQKQTSASQRGGGPQPFSPLDMDPTRSKFWDKWIRKITHTIGYYLPHTPLSDLCKNWDFYIYFLYSLEQIDLFGPFISAALDSITLSLPVLSDLASETIESIFILLPIPYAAIVGQVVGYAIGTLFLLFALMLNMNRKHFGSAFKVSLELIPMFGDILTEAAVNFEVAMERAMASRQRMLGSIQQLSPTAYSIADYYVPSVNIKTSMPPENIFSRKTVDKIGKNLQNYAVSRLPIPKEKMETISSVASNIMDIGPVVVDTATSLLTGQLNNVGSKLQAQAEAAAQAAVAEKVGAVQAAVNEKVGAVQAAVNEKVGAVQAAINEKVGNAQTAVAEKINVTQNAVKKGMKGGRRTRNHRVAKRRRTYVKNRS